MRRAGMLVMFAGAWILGSGAAIAQSPAAPSHIAVTRAMEKLTEALNGPIPGGQEALPGWTEFLGTIRNDLDKYTKAATFADRLTALDQLAGSSQALATIAWQPANDLRAALDAWTQPRRQVSATAEALRQVIAGTPASPEDANHRKGWTNFVDNYLSGAFRAYESATTVQAKQKALTQLNEALVALERAANWQPSLQAAWAARSLLSAPNLDVTADPNSLAKFFARELVQTGPVTRKGYTSQVTAGPYLGFGLFPSDEGIGFYNAQALSNYTPIWDFQHQLEADQKGQRVAKIYQFSAASTDASNLTVMTLISPAGLRLWSTATHNTDALIGAANQPGKGLQRAVLGLIGMNREKIRQKVYEGGIDKIRTNLDRESAEERAERMAAAEAEQNAKLRNILVGNNMALINNILITGLAMRSQPTYALINGTIGWNGAPIHLGADQPQPPHLNVLEPGVVADVHLSSILANLTQGAWQTPTVQEVSNLLVETRPPGKGEAVKVRRNINFADYLGALGEAKALNDPKAQAIWIKKPSAAPTYGVDARGYLVVMIPDFQLDVPVPAALASSTNNAKILRIQSPLAELVLDIKVKPGTAAGEPLAFAGGIKEFNAGPGAKVLTINDDESKAVTIDRLRSTVILVGLGRALASQPLNLPLNNVKLPGYDIRNIYDLDPSGWLRVVLAPNSEPIAVQ